MKKRRRQKRLETFETLTIKFEKRLDRIDKSGATIQNIRQAQKKLHAIFEELKIDLANEKEDTRKFRMELLTRVKAEWINVPTHKLSERLALTPWEHANLRKPVPKRKKKREKR
jgi:transcription antitermination factor NusA-like protein